MINRSSYSARRSCVSSQQIKEQWVKFRNENLLDNPIGSVKILVNYALWPLVMDYFTLCHDRLLFFEQLPHKLIFLCSDECNSFSKCVELGIILSSVEWTHLEKTIDRKVRKILISLIGKEIIFWRGFFNHRKTVVVSVVYYICQGIILVLVVVWTYPNLSMACLYSCYNEEKKESSSKTMVLKFMTHHDDHQFML